MAERSFAWLLFALLLPATASAQIECSNEGRSEPSARALFRQGVDATNDERWSDAVRSLRRAYELSCHPPALLNLGVSLRALGRHRESRDVLSQLLTDHPDLPAEVSSLAQRFLIEERARVAVVEIEIVEVSPDQAPEISFDGQSVAADEARPIRIETDAGGHSLEVRIRGYEPFTWTGELTDGQVERMVVQLEPMSTMPTRASTRAPRTSASTGSIRTAMARTPAATRTATAS